MGYARSWSVAEPYVLTSQDSDQAPLSDSPGYGQGPSLPLEAVNDGAGAMIRLKTPQLPSFLQR